MTAADPVLAFLDKYPALAPLFDEVYTISRDLPSGVYHGDSSGNALVSDGRRQFTVIDACGAARAKVAGVELTGAEVAEFVRYLTGLAERMRATSSNPPPNSAPVLVDVPLPFEDVAP